MAELKVRAKNYEAFHRSQHVPAQDLSALAVIGLAIVLKHAKNITPTPEEETYIEEIVATSAILQTNNAILTGINVQLEAGETPDMKLPWVKKP